MTTPCLPGLLDPVIRPVPTPREFRGPRPLSLTEQVAAFFRARPNQWINFHALAEFAGVGGWRTRISDCRRLFGMEIQNRVRRVVSPYGPIDAQGRQAPVTCRVSEYRYVPQDGA